MRAYALYRERGGKVGDDMSDWLRAEREYQRKCFSNLRVKARQTTDRGSDFGGESALTKLSLLVRPPSIARNREASTYDCCR